MKPINARPLPFVQETRAIHQYVTLTLVGQDFAIMFNLHLVLSLVVVPGCTDDFVVEFDVLPELVFLTEVQEVLLDLRCVGIVGLPPGIGFERVGIDVCRAEM
jgi:hypothetical protein